MLELVIIAGILLMLKSPKPFSHLPLDRIFITQRFKGAAHEGVDFDCAIGDPLFSIGEGVVGATGEDSINGRFVRLDLNGDDGNLYRVHYLHMNRVAVVTGSNVFAGQTIGEGGNTGRVRAGKGGDGSHLHLEIHRVDAGGARVLVDPSEVLPL